MNQNSPVENCPVPQTPPSRRQRGPASVVSWIALGCSLAALCLSLVAALGLWPEEKEPETLPEEVPPVVEAEPETEYLTYREHQIPIVESVPVNAYDPTAFSLGETGWLCYEKDGVTGIPGIDVSSHQGEIDWEKVAQSGIRFAMVRVGYRGYGEEGKLVLDERYERNLKGALDAGLEVGAYFFSQATSVWEVEEEMELFLGAIEGYDLTYPVAFDWEYIANKPNARTAKVTGEAVSRMADFFCHTMEEAGYASAVYFNQDMGYLSLDLDRLKDRTFWLAEYDAAPEFYYHFDLWQYSSKGTVPGVKTPVDMNLSFRDFSQE